MNERTGLADAMHRPTPIVTSSERIAVLVDGSNVYSTAKAIGLEIDYKLFREYYRTHGVLLRISYYTALIEEEHEASSIRPLIDWLDYNGFDVVSKRAKKFTDPVTGVVKIKGNMDCEMSTDALSLAYSGKVDRIILYTGDGDFAYLVEKLKSIPVRVTVVSTIISKPPMCADELRRAADEYIDLFDMRAKYAKIKFAERYKEAEREYGLRSGGR